MRFVHFVFEDVRRIGNKGPFLFHRFAGESHGTLGGKKKVKFKIKESNTFLS